MKNLNFVAVLTIATLLASCACSPSQSDTSSAADSSASATTSTEVSGDYYETLTVTFHSNGGSEVASQTLNYATKATRPTDPTREGYTFLNWYWDEVCVTPYDFNLKVFAPLDLYAGWKEGSSPATSSSSEASSSESDVTYVDYYLAGSFTSPSWKPDANYRLQEDPSGNNLGVLTGLSLTKGDKFKVVKSSDGSTISDWYGGNTSAASGQSGWHTDTSDNNNVVIDTTGSFTLYLNKDKLVWLAKE
ncbi:MAG: InlB B-repeat-containing protein [Bacilli bacterium]|nr:InlB B-repeat-containing protein [Bacilli bacterium]